MDSPHSPFCCTLAGWLSVIDTGMGLFNHTNYTQVYSPGRREIPGSHWQRERRALSESPEKSLIRSNKLVSSLKCSLDFSLNIFHSLKRKVLTCGIIIIIITANIALKEQQNSAEDSYQEEQELLLISSENKGDKVKIGDKQLSHQLKIKFTTFHENPAKASSSGWLLARWRTSAKMKMMEEATENWIHPIVHNNFLGGCHGPGSRRSNCCWSRIPFSCTRNARRFSLLFFCPCDGAAMILCIVPARQPSTSRRFSFYSTSSSSGLYFFIVCCCDTESPEQ